jgi:hypothetical protein
MSVSRLSFVMPAVLAGLLVSAVPASAQFPAGRSDIVGEDYHVEASFNFWGPTPDAIINSSALGIAGTDIDIVEDLGIEKQRLRDVRVVLRPAPKHRFRINYVPMVYDARSTVTREFIFNGLRYRPGLPVDTTAQFKIWRFGYEYDFLYRERGFLGVLVDAKYTDVNVGLNSPLGDEFTKAVGALPTLGLVGRVYAAKNLALNGEFSYFKLPESAIEDVQGRYKDYDFSATFNPHKNVGVQVGYRSIDVLYNVDLDNGTLTFKGLYFGGTVRF